MFSDEEWLSFRTLLSCILKETSQNLQLPFALSSDITVNIAACVFVFVGRRDFRCLEELILIGCPLISGKAVNLN